MATFTGRKITVFSCDYFDDPNDWPLSFLVFIDTLDFSYHRLKKVNSSWPQWTYEHINETDFNIITEYTDTYKTKHVLDFELLMPNSFVH